MFDLHPFAKMNGLGNEILVIDVHNNDNEQSITKNAILNLAKDPHMSFDQIMLIKKPDNNGVFWLDIFNRDGSQAQACGNGTRCVAEYLFNLTKQKELTYQTKNNLLKSIKLDNGDICVDMGKAFFSWDKIPLAYSITDTAQLPLTYPQLGRAAAVNVSNPHVVFWLKEDVNDFPLQKFGPLIENDKLFPEKVNVSIVNIKSKQHIKIRTWERGAGLTLACGSAACATTILSHKIKNTSNKLKVSMPGGTLFTQYTDDGHIFMTGSTELEFTGIVSIETGTYEKRNI
ncbi:diaminopimelate epimerase [Bartonella sp. DGB1]|uniref:diaminopimelate epimerase n=1 Tax=Bartonella sp. DGB1 TaxID=3239807 RepID=UPI0035258C3A